jgi:pseudouridine synthase
MINKPRGYISTLTDPQKRLTIIDLIPEIKKRLYPVGRLDQNTTGLLVLTDDGELAYRLSHPKFGVEKTYEVEIKGQLSPQDISNLEQGIELEGKVTSEAKIKIISTAADKTRLTIKVHQGRKRQIRRMFQAINCSVINLKRIEYAGLKLDNLKEGRFRHLTKNEISLLREKVGLSK